MSKDPGHPLQLVYTVPAILTTTNGTHSPLPSSQLHCPLSCSHLHCHCRSPPSPPPVMGYNVIPSTAPATGLSPPRTIGGYDVTSTARKCPCIPIGKPSRVPSSTRTRNTTFAATATAGSEGVAEEDLVTRTPGSSTRSQLDLLEQLASSKTSGSGYQSDSSSRGLTIREQLAELVGEGYGEFTLPLGKKLKASVRSLTISQKRNIRRQNYMNVVSQRNDSVFFATIGAFVILPPIVILAVAVITGYVQLLP